MDIEPDTKDWTWVLDRACPDCGADVSATPLADVPAALLDNASAWGEVLARTDVGRRPTPTTWSPLEYACHVVEVHLVFDRRLRLLLESDDPAFENWDQDAAAERGRYAEQQPATVADALGAVVEHVAQRYGSVRPDQADRPGRRSNGAVFTVTTLARYHLHDVLHHLWDVRQ